MAAEKSYARLGFFIVVTLTVVLATAVLFIQRMRSKESIKLVTYTVENVSGLDVSSPVRYRGVPMGRVTDIRVDPSGPGNVIEIDFEVFLDRLNTVGFDIRKLRRITDAQKTFPRLRAQVIGNPVTGEAYLLLDSPQNPPPSIELGFTPNRSYVPAIRSPFATVQERLPAILDRAEVTLQTLNRIVARIPDSLDRSDRFFSNMERIAEKSDLPALSTDSRKFFTTTSAQMEQMSEQMEQMGSDMGKFSSETRAAIKAADFPTATQSVRDAAENSKLASDDLRRSLPAIRDSLDQVRELARQLQEQPESVVYGPRPPTKAKH